MAKFSKGDKVKLGGDWAQHCQYNTSRFSPVGKRGTVVGQSRTKDCTRIIFDGQKTPQTFHNTFLEAA